MDLYIKQQELQNDSYALLEKRIEKLVARLNNLN